MIKCASPRCLGRTEPVNELGVCFRCIGYGGDPRDEDYGITGYFDRIYPDDRLLEELHNMREDPT